MKVAVFSLKFKRFLYVTILRTTGEVAYYGPQDQHIKVIGLETKTNGNYVYEGRSLDISVLSTRIEYDQSNAIKHILGSLQTP